MSKTFNERVDSSVEFLHDHFNHKRDDDPPTREELKEILVTVLRLIKADFDGN